jgi:predicted nucleic-acid-binding protein
MRIKMAGAYWLHDFQEAIDHIVASLKHNGVDQLRGVNLYLQLFGQGERIEFDNQECGTPFEILEYARQRRQEFRPISQRLQPGHETQQAAVSMPTSEQLRPAGDIESFTGLPAERPVNPNAAADPTGALEAGKQAGVKIVVTADVLVRAVLRNDEDEGFAAGQVLKSAELIAIPIGTLCDFVALLRFLHGLEPDAIAGAIRSLCDAKNVVVDRSAVAAGLEMLQNGGEFYEGVIASEGQRLGANRFVSFDQDAVERIVRLMPHYR